MQSDEPKVPSPAGRVMIAVAMLLIVPAAIALALWLNARDDPPEPPNVAAVTEPASPSASSAISEEPSASESPSPSPSPSPTASASSSPSPSASAAIAPLVPYDGTPPTTDAEVRAVYDRMVAAAGDIGAYPDPAKVDALYDPACTCYQPFKEYVSELVGNGEYGRGQPPAVLEFEVQLLGSDPTPRFGVRVLRQLDPEAQTFDAEGRAIATRGPVPPEELVVDAVVRDGGWFFTRVDSVIR